MKTQYLQPFGVEIVAESQQNLLAALPAHRLRAEVAEHRLIVLRGFASPDDDEMLAFCRQLGDLLEWEFGAVNELVPRAEAGNYLYSNRAVPFHWDGAFAGRVPHYIFFHCRTAPALGSGGETIFCDTVRLLEGISSEERAAWERIRITYRTEKIVHYGGTFTAPMIDHHPVSGQFVLRFAEPVEDVNPVHLSIDGVAAADRLAFLARLHELLNDPSLCYAHAWRANDVLLADNHALLHGRRAFDGSTPRHLRRINIL
ncbi:MAG TPA: TauD/TfdA family dioxygenase [Gemmataceae bacterium]|nr:TauD/TfdA family dioxygenase [Gemmataceae bacterium]